MSTTTAERLAQATRREGDRKVTYTWRNPVMDKQYHEPNDAGEQIELRFAHDPQRKQYTATMRIVWWQVSAGHIVTMFAIGDHKNYPSVRFHNELCARYSDKAFAKFEAETIALLNDLPTDTGTPLAGMLQRILATPKAVDAC